MDSIPPATAAKVVPVAGPDHAARAASITAWSLKPHTLLTVYARTAAVAAAASANRGDARGRLPWHAGLHDVAHDHFVDGCRVDLRALDRGADRRSSQVGRGER